MLRDLADYLHNFTQLFPPFPSVILNEITLNKIYFFNHFKALPCAEAVQMVFLLMFGHVETS